MNDDFQIYLKEKTIFFENELKKELAELSYPETISKGMEYAILNGGKRLRPILLFITLELLGVDIKKGIKSARSSRNFNWRFTFNLCFLYVITKKFEPFIC